MLKKPLILFASLMRPLMVLVVSMAISGMVFGQGANIKFKHLSLKEGLSQSSINCAFQDSRGFMWFGTQDGLNKYDGYKFTVFKHIPEDTTTLTNGFVNSLLQIDNFLWIATNKGINLLDFETQSFKKYTTTNSLLQSDAVNHMFLDSDSNIWIGTDLGLSFYNRSNKRFENFQYQENGAVKDVIVLDLIEDDQENLWLATENSGLLLFDKSSRTIKPFDLTDDFQEVLSGQINTLFKNGAGDIMVGTAQSGLLLWYKGETSFIQHENKNGYLNLTSNYITSIFQDHEGVIWVGTNGGGLHKFFEQEGVFYNYKRIVNDESSLSSNNISTIFEDRAGVLWVGSELGINYFDLLKQNFNHYQPGASTINSISGNIVWSIFEDEKELLWIGTNEGLNTFDRDRNIFQSFLPTIIVDGEKRNTSIYAINKDRSGRLWLGTDGGLFRFNEANNSFSSFAAAQNTSRTYVIFEDSRSRIWVGTKEGIVVLSSSGNFIRKIVKSNTGENSGLPDDVTRTILEDSDGNFWIGTDGGLCRISTSSSGKLIYKNFKNDPNDPSSLSNNTVLSLQEDGKGYIWVGTFGGGLNRYDKKSESFIHYTQRDGLPNNVVYGILKDNNNTLWLSTNRGISSFSLNDKSFNNFDESDGLQSNEFNVGAHFKSTSGELFFGGIKGFNSFDPSRIRKNEIRPQVILTDFELFNKPVQIGPNSKLKKHISELDEIVLSYADNVFSFSFAALHYSMPERNRYAYKMEGFDENWIYDDNSRRAKYTNLDPDNYVFKVKGTNSDGYWGEEVSIDVIIKPPFWKIKWVWALAIFIIAFAGFSYYQTRLKRIKAQKEILERQVKERTKELIGKNEEVEKQRTLLEEEKDKLETLLLNILPQSTVEELKKKGKATARNYRLASVMFTDFKNFTKISEKLTPTELVEKLDSFFVKFDGIIEKYNVEKIKTIGDAYMCAGGIPIRNKSNPVDVVLASLEIQRTMKEFKESSGEGEEPWGLRLGVHTGNLVAGVIGIKRFAYDIWGDTVNVASRVESGGEVGRVNISGDTYDQIKEFFVCEYRGKIHAKNKGEIDMYFVNGIKPELSIDNKGIEPNKAFWEYVNLTIFSTINYRELETMILEKLRVELADDLYYHGVHHTIDVCEAVERIAHQEGVEGENIFILKAAALFHDAGYLSKYGDNEHIGVELAKKYLPDYGFEQEQIDLIEKLILITFVENEPTTHLEKIIRDADLDYLGRGDFNDISDSLKRELMDRSLIKDEQAWDELQVKFISSHEYYTASSKALREKQKVSNLDKIQERLKAKIKQ